MGAGGSSTSSSAATSASGATVMREDLLFAHWTDRRRPELRGLRLAQQEIEAVVVARLIVDQDQRVDICVADRETDVAAHFATGCDQVRRDHVGHDATAVVQLVV